MGLTQGSACGPKLETMVGGGGKAQLLEIPPTYALQKNGKCTQAQLCSCTIPGIVVELVKETV